MNSQTVVPYRDDSGLWGFEMGKIFRQEALYDSIKEYKEGFFGVKKMGKWGLIDPLGNTWLNTEYEWIGEFLDGAVIAQKDGMKGLVNSHDRVVVDFKYYYIRCNSSEYCQIINEDFRYGVIDRKGAVIIPAEYRGLEITKDGFLVKISESDRMGLLDFDGSELIPPGDYVITCLGGGKFLKQNNGQIERPLEGTFTDQTVKAQFTEIVDTNNILYKDFEFCASLLDKNLLFAAKCSVYPNLDTVKWGVVDAKSLEILIPIVYDSVCYRGDYFGVFLNKKMGLIDSGKNVLVPLIYDYVGFSKDFYVPVNLGGVPDLYEYTMKGGKWGFYDILKNSLIIPCEYDEVDSFEKGTARVRKNREEYYIDTKGNRMKP
jgi:hypothetical protein